MYSFCRCTVFLYTAIFCTGCITIPNKNDPFCVPQVKVYRDAKKIYTGVRCHY